MIDKDLKLYNDRVLLYFILVFGIVLGLTCIVLGLIYARYSIVAFGVLAMVAQYFYVRKEIGDRDVQVIIGRAGIYSKTKGFFGWQEIALHQLITYTFEDKGDEHMLKLTLYNKEVIEIDFTLLDFDMDFTRRFILLKQEVFKREQTKQTE